MDLKEFSLKLKLCNKIVFFTGAGISTESGVPDFRSPGGIWTKYKPVYFDEFCSSEEARVRYWKMKKESFELYRDVSPNKGHYAIAEIDKRGQMLGLITQNIDGLHSIAGIDDEKLVELHGTDRKITCLDCGKEFDSEAIYEGINGEFRSPVCDSCKGLLKPATVSFGQPMPPEAMQIAGEWSRGAEVFIVLGSSLQVQPAASFPVLAKDSGAVLAIVNRDPTPLDDIADHVYHGGIGSFFGEPEGLMF